MQGVAQPSSHILGRAFQGPPFRHLEMVVRSQVLNQVVLARETIGAFAGAVLDGAVAKNGVVDAGLVTLQVCKAREGFAAVVAAEGLSWSREIIVSDRVPYEEAGRRDKIE